MTKAPRLRKLAFIAHISSSVGWLGAVAGFLALAIIGLTGQDVQMVGAAYLGMAWIGWFVLLPLSFASLLTGLVQSLSSEWGLFRHYWILAKFLINALGTVGLLLFMLLFGCGVAAGTTASGADVSELKSPSPLLHAGVALLVLLATTSLSVYKPRGLTPYGRRKQQERRTALQQKKQQQRALAQPEQSFTKHPQEPRSGVHHGRARAGAAPDRGPEGAV